MAKKAKKLDVMVVQAKVKDYIREESGCNVAGDVMEALTLVVASEVDKACQRAIANGRKTVRATDF